MDAEQFLGFVALGGFLGGLLIASFITYLRGEFS